MDTIDNLRKLFLKENWKYLVLVIWLLVGVGLVQFAYTRLVGLLSFLPFLTFLMYLFLFSLFAKKDVKEVASWKVLLIFFLSLPVMLLIAFVLIIIFAFSLLSYIFFTSWFILYGAFLSSRRLDDVLKRKKHSQTHRSFEFFGGLGISILLSVGYILNSQNIGAFLGETISTVIHLSNYVILFVLIVIGVFSVFVIIYLFKKVFAAWLGLWFVLLVIYTFYLLIKIFLAFRSATGVETSSIFTQSILLIADFLVILYTISTLMGSQAEMLMKRLNRKRLGLDTIVLWLVFSKVAYEFVHYFPFSDLDILIQWFPNISLIVGLNADLVNLIKNILVLGFFLLTLLIIGFYEFAKYFKNQKQLGEKIEEHVSPKSAMEKITEIEEKIFYKEEETENVFPTNGFNYIQDHPEDLDEDNSGDSNETQDQENEYEEESSNQSFENSN